MGKRKTNIELKHNIGQNDELPNQLVIRDGSIVVAATGKPPVFPPGAFDGQPVSLVLRSDITRLRNINKLRRNALRAICETINDLAFEETK